MDQDLDLNYLIAQLQNPLAPNFYDLDQSSSSFKRNLLEAKVMIDRWDLTANKIVLHPIYQYPIEDNFIQLSGYYFIKENVPIVSHGIRVWGMEVIFDQAIPEEIGLILSIFPEYFQFYDPKDPCYLRAAALFSPLPLHPKYIIFS